MFWRKIFYYFSILAKYKISQTLSHAESTITLLTVLTSSGEQKTLHVQSYKTNIFNSKPQCKINCFNRSLDHLKSPAFPGIDFTDMPYLQSFYLCMVDRQLNAALKEDCINVFKTYNKSHFHKMTQNSIRNDFQLFCNRLHEKSA